MQERDTKIGAVRIDGVDVSAVDVRFRPANYQALLERARKTGDAQCLCSSKSLKLSIKKRGDSYHLAVWPDQAALHDHACPFYSGPIHPPAAEIHERSEKPVVETMLPVKSALPLDLWDVLHSVWQVAGLNKWSPGWRRDWGLVRALLLRAAKSYMAEGSSFAERLYIPPVFSQEKKQSINEEWLTFCGRMDEVGDLRRPHSQSKTSSFLLGVVASVEPCSRGILIRLQHHYSKVFLSSDQVKRIARFSRRGWSQLQIQQQSKSSVVAMLAVEMGDEGRLVARDCVLMRLGARFIPSNFEAEDFLLMKLLDEGRAFERPLSFAQSHKQCANFVLTDTPKRKTELHLTGGGFPVHRIDAWTKERNQIAQSRGCNSWFWHKPAPMGDLPEADKRIAP